MNDKEINKKINQHLIVLGLGILTMITLGSWGMYEMMKMLVSL